MAQTRGIVTLWWNGKQYDVQKGSRWRRPGKQNSDVEGTARTLRSQKYQAGMVQATILVTSDMSVSEFDPSLGERELQIQDDLGKTLTISDAYVRSFPDEQDNGQAQINWTFNTFQEIS